MGSKKGVSLAEARQAGRSEMKSETVDTRVEGIAEDEVDTQAISEDTEMSLMRSESINAESTLINTIYLNHIIKC
jgi:hypothetical protein